MKRVLISLLILAFPLIMLGQEVPTATLKIDNIHVEVDGKKVEWDQTFEVVLTDGIMSSVIIYEKEGLKYGTEFIYKKGRNRIKLARRGYAIKSGLETKFAKKEKDMQELKTSAPGNLKKRVVDNILISREKFESVNVSFNYELIYK